jgi:aminodeoxychorismate synthase component I
LRAGIVCRELDWDLSPADVLRLVRTDPHPVALLGTWAGDSHIIAAAPVATRHPPGPLAPVLATWMPGTVQDVAEENRGSGFAGGWIGYLGFGAAGEFLPVPPPPGGQRRLPDWWFGYYDHVLRHDRLTGRWFFEALPEPSRADAVSRRLADLERRVRTARRYLRGQACAVNRLRARPLPGQPADQPWSTPLSYECGTFRIYPSPEEHREAIRQTVEYIRGGDIFQANICLQLAADFDGDPLDAFCAAATRLDPPYAAFLRLDNGAIASLSPELFLRRNGKSVWSSPIKGTSPRSADDPEAARRSRQELENSAKDGAENVMIVDLMRNDLSRVCEPGSVTAPALLRAEPHPGVWHLVSDVTGTLAAGLSDGNLMAATFPPGSVTGAPKVRALEIIHELEAVPREAYTGAIGFRSPVAGLELNVAIRTFEFHNGRVWLGSGGGITARSDPATEYRECLDKAVPLVRALGSAVADASAPPSAARPQTVSASSGSRTGHAEQGAGAIEIPQALLPRPAAGVFTSLRITEGHADGLADHLARLEASTRALYGKPLPPGLYGQLAECLPDMAALPPHSQQAGSAWPLAGRPSGRLRITVRPVGGPLLATVEVAPAGPVTVPVTLRPVTVPGGLGPHKWRDRRLLAHLAAQAGLGPEEHLLLADVNGDILETDRASVFAVLDGILCTPPADARILPGIGRAETLRRAETAGIAVKETPLTLPRLREATELLVTNSVHGVIPARLRIPDSPQAVSRPHGPVALRLLGDISETSLTVPVPPGVPDDSGRRRPATNSPARRDAVRHSAIQHRVLQRRPAPRPSPLVVLIDNYDSFTYNLVHLLRVTGCDVEVVRNDEVAVNDIKTFAPDGILISPGPCTPAEAGISIDTVRTCGPVIPLLGICLGHQAIAAAYGARIVRAPAPAHGYASPVTHDAAGVLAGLPQDFLAARYHSLIVDEGTLPADLRITARGPHGIPMALRHIAYPVEGLQLHPESILTPVGRPLIANWRSTLS